MVYRTDIDHPLSMHNTITNQNIKVEFPKTANNLQGQKAQFTLNGYYSKEPVSLKNGFKADPTALVQPVDYRIYNEQENFNQKNLNNVYQPNFELLNEIQNAKQQREYQRTIRHEQQEIIRQVEEISPSGVKRQIGPGSAGASPQ
jgi:hypothetical protein